MTDSYADGTPSLFTVKRPNGTGWREVPGAQQFGLGYPARAFFHDRHNLAVISAVEVASDENKGPEYHISVSKQLAGPQRCTSDEARWVLAQFDMDGAEEDNHVPIGKVRNFWRPLATGLIGKDCACKADESAIVEDKGDFVWRGVPKK